MCAQTWMIKARLNKSSNAGRGIVIHKVCETTGLSVDLVSMVLDCVLATISAELASGRKRMEFRGFGVFSNVILPAHWGNDVVRRKKMLIPKMRVVKFRAGKHLRQLVKDHSTGESNAR